jgi:hypothetical protein
MNTPKFTAEASLYKTSKHYTTMPTGIASSTQVVPQFGLCDKARALCARGYENWCLIEERFCEDDF